MTPEEIFKNRACFFRNDMVGGLSCSIGYIKEFRWSWFATQLNTFIFVADTSDLIDRKFIETFSNSCYRFALKNNKGWPRGLQAGIASLAMLRGTKIDAPAIQFCKALSKKHWSAFEVPILYNLDKRELIRYNSNPLWGKIFFPYFSKIIDEVSVKF